MSDSRTLDLVFAMDSTGSMTSYITSAKENIQRIVETIVAKESCDVRMALVNYRDHYPQAHQYVTDVHDFTSSVSEMEEWLSKTIASEGGDRPEAVADALFDVTQLNWRQEATKVCVLICDAPPHGLLSTNDSLPNGCPDNHDCIRLSQELAQSAITLYVAGCEPSIRDCREFFQGLAHITGGQYVPLQSAKHLANVIVGSAEEEMDLENLLSDVDRALQDQEQQESEEHLLERVYGQLKGRKTNQLQMNSCQLPSAVNSSVAMKFSEVTSMQEAKNAFTKNLPPGCEQQNIFGSVPLGGSCLKPFDEITTHLSEPEAHSNCDFINMGTPQGSPAFSATFGGHLNTSTAPTMNAWKQPPMFGGHLSAPAAPAMNTVGGLAPGVSAMNASGNAEYQLATGDISREQVQRLIKKSKARNNLK